jgi:hypothetical protein
MPVSGVEHRRPQQSPAAMHVSPAGLQPGAGGAQWFAMHTPSQQSCATAQGPLAGEHAGAPHMAPAPQPRLQHAPARAHDCPSDAQPVGLRQTCVPAPVPSSPHTSEQQSEATRQIAPSA